ncbi:MAG: permease prefix domain 1-containing protein [Steroidobacteraceae bacterium]
MAGRRCDAPKRLDGAVSHASLEEQIAQWRGFLERHRAIRSPDTAELEDHLRSHIEHLMTAGLDAEEAFLVAVKRMGSLDALSREFAREHSDRLWKQLVIGPQPAHDTATHRDALVAILFAGAAAVAIKLPALFGIDPEHDEAFYLRNAAFFALPLLFGYFARVRRLAVTELRWPVAALLTALVVANVSPALPPDPLAILTVIHLPIALWLPVGIAYAGGRWSEVAARMDFIRFSGELFIYYVLIALGGFVLIAFTVMTFNAIGVNPERFIGSWLVPCGAAAAFLIAAWLVEAKQSVIENMAPVLTRLFTPLFAALLLAFLAALAITGRGIDIERNVLIGFDLLLAIVLALLLYSISARDPHAPPGAFDAIQLTLVLSALLANGVALSAMALRIDEFGFTPNRVAALGENLILAINLAGSAHLYLRFLRSRAAFASLERWQTAWLPLYAAWAAFVALVFPFLFD